MIFPRISIYTVTMKWIFLAIMAIILLVSGFFFGQKTNPTSLANQNIQAPTPQSEQHIDKTFSFPVTDTEGKKVTNISYTITTVAKQNDVIIKGIRANAVSGRTFLIINIKLTNTSSQTIQLNSRDYIRISTGKSSDLFAASMYNDPIVIQPVSTEYTRIGFPIDSNENNITLHVGEISGSKTNIPISFK